MWRESTNPFQTGDMPNSGKMSKLFKKYCSDELVDVHGICKMLNEGLSGELLVLLFLYQHQHFSATASNSFTVIHGWISIFIHVWFYSWLNVWFYQSFQIKQMPSQKKQPGLWWMYVLYPLYYYNIDRTNSECLAH